MRNVNAEKIIEPLGQMIRQTLACVDSATQKLVERAHNIETAPLCKWALGEIVKNNRIAKETGAFPCQDCGQAVLFVSLGQNLHIDGSLPNALQKGVELGYSEARKSVADPLTRVNTGTNTPAVIHYELTDGEQLVIAFLAKGAGAENMSRVFMLTPSKGEQGIINSVAETVEQAGSNPCPPIILGVGIGGTMEMCALLSKKALLRGSGMPSPIPQIRELEETLLARVNTLNIGAQGFGGRITALSVAIETAPTHIGMLPVAVNVQCHSVRHGKLII